MLVFIPYIVFLKINIRCFLGVLLMLEFLPVYVIIPSMTFCRLRSGKLIAVLGHSSNLSTDF